MCGREVMGTAEVYRPTRMDRLILFGRRILESYRMSENAVIFICVDAGRWRLDAIMRRRRQEARHAILRISFPGNIQYHRIEYEQIERYIMCLRHAKYKLKEMEV